MTFGNLDRACDFSDANSAFTWALASELSGSLHCNSPSQKKREWQAVAVRFFHNAEVHWQRYSCFPLTQNERYVDCETLHASCDLLLVFPSCLAVACYRLRYIIKQA